MIDATSRHIFWIICSLVLRAALMGLLIGLAGTLFSMKSSLAFSLGWPVFMLALLLLVLPIYTGGGTPLINLKQ